jgi:hypothetical protein
MKPNAALRHFLSARWNYVLGFEFSALLVSSAECSSRGCGPK